MVNYERYRAAGPPDGGDHTDKDKAEEDIFDRAYSSSGHCQYLYRRMSLPEGVTEKHQIAEKQGPENGVACQNAAEQYKGKDHDDNSFHKISPAAERRNFLEVSQ